MDEPIIHMTRIVKRFGGRVALEEVNLELEKGEILGLIGDNGAGKSTLLKILSGALKKDGGAIYLEGRKVDIKSPSHSRRLGIEMVYQDLSLCRNLTVWENIFLGRMPTRGRGIFRLLQKKEMVRRTRDGLRFLGIGLEDMEKPVQTLSGGEQQAVALCRSLLFRPRVILLDEPTASMGVWEKQKILGLIQDLKRQDHSLILVTHNLQDLLQVADRALVLKEGKRIWCGPLQGVRAEDLAQKMFAGF